MFLILFALLMVIPWVLSDKVSTKPGLKMFRDEYKSIKETCLDLGFVKKSCNSGSERNVVAFDVRLKNDVNNLASNVRVVFGTVDLKEGIGYDPSTGIFTAPSAGLYVFDWTTLTHLGKYVYTSLVVNDSFKSWNLCRGKSLNTHLSCSKMTIVKLKQGDKVWIGVFSGPANINAKFTSFSGYKM
uniref:Complement C1q tumor necrosis factor-related protein 2-like n=1 Tax=Crassostrea virginica TaxID=6565 RepID=A0A8B8BNK3_CRAVI|nr:complement C1q tumor necrosis factor-related protein 2-like [Crassostrea virginica]